MARRGVSGGGRVRRRARGRAPDDSRRRQRRGARFMSGFVDLHCHMLWGLDDGAKTLDDTLEMARALVDLGFKCVAPSPHARPEYAPRALALERLAEVQSALRDQQ